MAFWTLPLFVICDLFTFPLLDIGPISWRVSYLLILWLCMREMLASCLNVKNYRVVLWSMPFMAAALIIVTTIGHLIASVSYDLIYGYEATKSITYIIFMAMAYFAGKKVHNFNYNILIFAFFMVIVVNICFTIGVNFIPNVIFNLYFPEKLLSGSFADSYGIKSIEALKGWYRPLGPHGSPTYSAFAVNVMYTFFVVAHLKKYIITNGNIQRLFVLLAPILLALLYSSRTEFVSSVFLSFVLYYHWYARKPRWLYNIRLAFFVITGSIVLFSMLLSFLELNSDETTVIDIVRFTDFLENPMSGGKSSAEGAGGSGEVRSTFMFHNAWERFVISPVFGTGLGEGSSDILNTVWFYHNDLFYILVTSGILGFCLYFVLIKKYIYSIHPVLITPFILPGLTNSFLLVFPMVIAYFYLLGVFSNSVVKKQSTHSGLHNLNSNEKVKSVNFT